MFEDTDSNYTNWYKRKKETSNKGSNGQDMIEDKSVLVDGIEREEDSLAVCRANLLVAGSYSLGSRYSLGSQVKSVERTLRVNILPHKNGQNMQLPMFNYM